MPIIGKIETKEKKELISIQKIWLMFFQIILNNVFWNTKLYDDTNTFDELNPVLTREVSVVDLDTVSAIFRYKRKEKRTAILNFASYKNAGGMFLQGSSAQEESLCHASFLYNVLSEFKDYYAWNDKHKNRALYENRALYSPDVVFTNDSVGTLCWCNYMCCTKQIGSTEILSCIRWRKL